MSVSREQLHKLIDQLPDDKLPKIGDILVHIYEESQISKEEEIELDAARERIMNGEFKTFEEVFGDIDV